MTVHEALSALPRGRWLLAVSGGRDSMVLLDAMSRARAAEVAAVATFDHGTGPAARRACALVEREAERLGLPVITGVAAAGLPASETHWREARHRFLDSWANAMSAQVVTAHTRDDQIETVVQRLLRDAGPRGLAGMLGGGSERRVRPLLTVARAGIAAYAAACDIAYVDDPTNASLDFQRNRVRHELLPAFERATPGFSEWCWALGVRAAEWRAAVERFVDRLGVTPAGSGTTVVVPVQRLAGLTAPEWDVLWPALAARVGVVMDRRGIERASAWAPRSTAGQAIPLSGEARIERTLHTYVIRSAPVEAATGTAAAAPDYITDQ